jgi:hypothetical protein
LITASAAAGRVGLVVVGDDQIDAELARGIAAAFRANAAIHRDDDRAPPACSRSIGPAASRSRRGGDPARSARLPRRALERAAQDHGGRDAVDVVVAVNGDALAARDGAEQAIDRRPHVAEQKRIVQLVECGLRKRLAASGSPRPRWHSRRAMTGGTESAAAVADTRSTSAGTSSQTRRCINRPDPRLGERLARRAHRTELLIPRFETLLGRPGFDFLQMTPQRLVHEHRGAAVVECAPPGGSFTISSMSSISEGRAP